MLLNSGGSGALAPTPRARWATEQHGDKLGGQGVPEACSPGWSLFSSTSPPRESGVSGRREARAASLLVCVVGVVCVSFLVFGLIAVLLPLSQQHLEPTCSHFVCFLPGQALAVGRDGVVGSRARAQWAELAWMDGV